MAEYLFIKGYREETGFTKEQELSIPIMRRLVKLCEYATILYVLSEPIDDKPDWIEEIIKKLKGRLKEIESSIP